MLNEYILNMNGSNSPHLSDYVAFTTPRKATQSDQSPMKGQWPIRQLFPCPNQRPCIIIPRQAPPNSSIN